jgi:hypothetical protein
MNLGGGGQTQQTSQTTRPWPAQEKALTTGYDLAKTNIADRPTEFFPGQTYAGFSPQTEAALGATEARATAGSGLLGGAQDYTGDVLGGQYLDPASNPFLAGVSDSVLSSIRPGVDSMFAGGGRAGSPAHAEALGRGVSRGMAPYLFGEYGRERGMQEAAAGRAPGLAREDYYDPDRLAGVGAARETQEQRGINEDISRFEYGQNEPGSRATQYLQAIQGMPSFGDTIGTAKTESSVNPLLLALGSATKVGSAYAGNPGK